jgi:hypothetical protein
MIQNRELLDAVQEIMMIGVDCTTYAKFAAMLNMLNKGAAEGDQQSIELLGLVYKFAKLLELSQRTPC